MQTKILTALGACFALSSCVAWAEPVNVPAFTAFSEPKLDGIDVREGDGVYGWGDKTQSLVWYGDLRDMGALQVALKLTLPAGATASWKMSITGQNPDEAKNQSFVLTAKATGTGAEQNVDFGMVNIAKPGFYRVALEGVEKSGATFGDIKTLVLDGPAAATIVSKQGFNFTHWRGQTSVHLTYQLPKEETVTAFYNEVTAQTNPSSTYYCAIGFGGGYFGMQVTSPIQRRVIFSIWDNANEGVSRDKVEEKDRSGLLAKGDKVFAGGFGGEGTGGHSHLKVDWKTGEKQRFLVTVKPDGDASIFAGYFYRNDLKKWMLISAWRRPRTEAKLTGFYSFIEDFAHNAEATRRATFGNAWVRTADGKWQEPLTARFTRTAGKEPVRRDWEAGTQKDQFWMQIGGYIDRTTEYGDLFTRENSNRPPTDLELPPLPAKMPPPAPEVTLVPALTLLAQGKGDEAIQSAKTLAAGPDASPEVKEMALDIERLAAPEPTNYLSPSTVSATVNSVFLSDLAWASAQVGYGGKPYRNRAMTENNGDFPLLRTEEKVYEKGIFAHAPSHLTFDLGGKWKSFSALGGLQRGGNSVVFVVKGDGKELYHSPLVQGEDTRDIKINVSGVKTLELITEDGGDGNGSDWSVWFEPKITR
ncbi:hypothetical protein IAD21_04599 [Abditibacteriota bacterium]|nr:hypothetical protein IAD21_04599 [Abditibacteriota bacterium]